MQKTLKCSLVLCGLQLPIALAGVVAQDAAGLASASQTPMQTFLASQDREAWRKLLQWPDDCEQAFAYPDKSFSGLAFYPIAKQQTIVQVICTLGAYQGYQLYYLLDADQGPNPQPLVFETREAQQQNAWTKMQTQELWGLPSFDKKTKTLKILNKFRGLGDCGVLATYQFINAKPILTALRGKSACDGKGADKPERWPRIGR